MGSIKHVAIIMDGNGRWAVDRFRPRFWGHIRGSSIVSSIVKASVKSGLASLTLYAFSTENHKRSLEEKRVIYNLLEKYIDKEKKQILQEKICFNIIGDYSFLREGLQKKIKELIAETSDFGGLNLNFAFGYGGRAEIINAVKKISLERPNPSSITEEYFAKYLMNPQLEDIDLLIRTGGDKRISNFLLWQIAYAELYFTTTRWPDFSASEFLSILTEVEERERRFGGVRVKGHQEIQGGECEA